MPHRGRLNVLANIVGKSYAQIFREFEGNIDPRTVQGSGDVKYHLGSEGQFRALSGATIKTSVAANPSHLEAVNPVLEGIARAKQDILDRAAEFPVLPVLMHGDAAFAGQGVVAETLNLSQLRGYRTGGTIHIIVNNQVGFTTSPTESRSSIYCTDVARMIQAPIFHVNGDDPEACIRVARLAFAFRQEFHKDVVIDLICYRRRGHNEGDDPSFTQPRMYDLIEKKRSTRKLYTEALIGRGDITVEDAEAVMTRFQQRLESVFKEVRDPGLPAKRRWTTTGCRCTRPRPAAKHGTAITIETLKKIADAHTTFPDGFTVHPKVMPQLQRRAAAITQGPIDWATGEILALGSLLLDGRTVRLTGQDTRRGTFVQRFASIVDRKTGESWVPLKHLDDDQGKFHVFDSLLSEYAAMGFEYGYSVARPEALVLWEAQFGDFANGAQTIIDEFISSGQAKWTQKSGVVLLLPHGYEGQGPDHSSARIERWLQPGGRGRVHGGPAVDPGQPLPPAAAAGARRAAPPADRDDARSRCCGTSWRSPIRPTSPRVVAARASRPHHRPTRLRSPRCCSARARCAGTWSPGGPRTAARGKVAIIAVERLYPLPAKQIADQLSRFENVTEVRWVQDEPANQGAWPFMALNLPQALDERGPAAGRSPRSPGRRRRPRRSARRKVHEAQQRALMDAAFA